MGGNRAVKYQAGALAIAGTFAVSQATAQEDAGRPLLTFSFNQSLEASDNPDFIPNPTGTSFSSRTNLGLSFASSTRSQSINFDTGLDLFYRLATSSDDPVREGVRNPFLSFAYGTQSATAEFDFTAQYRKSDTGDLRLVTDPSGVDFIVDPGQVERTSFGVGLETGIGTPLGFSLDAEYRSRDFVDTVDPNLIDDEFLSARGTVRFAIDRSTDASLVARYARDQRLQGSDFDRRTQACGLRLDRDFDDVRSAGIEITSDVIETTELGVTDKVEDYSVVIDYDQASPNGNLSVLASSVLESTGPRNTLRFNRSYNFVNTTLSAFLGLTNGEGGDVNPLFGATVTRELPNGSITARISQVVRQERTSDNEVRNRALEVDYEQTINSVSSWNTGVSFLDSDNLTLGTNRQRANFRISYTRAVTEDWDLVSGYRFRNSGSNNEPDRSSNTLFVTLRRDFVSPP